MTLAYIPFINNSEEIQLFFYVTLFIHTYIELR
jgi:hypothetical protein